MVKRKGNLTLPSETGFLKETKEILDRWGADAIRDSDGTKLSDELKNLDAKIYTTYFVSRGHNEFAKQNIDECQHLYLMSNFNIATSNTVEIKFMEGYFSEQVKPDYDHDPKKWWEVINRTTGEVIDIADWEVDSEKDIVKVNNTKEFHEYTVSFLVYAIWDPTQMYNHITNDWGDKEHDIPFDVRKEKSAKFIEEYMDKWLEENKDTDVVRFTTFFYHFTLVFNDNGKEKFVDWFGYSASVSPEALDAFEKEKGYRLRPEHIIDQGYYNSSFRIPSKEFLDFMDFQQQFVSKTAKKLVDKVHDAGKEALMFLGDNWIGTEPYGDYFENIGLDGVVGSVGDGATLRMISEIPHVKYTEGRFLPYFFPDTFREGNDPVIEAKDNWLSARRAIMRKPVDRIGYGGYLSLAYKFPKFVEYVENVADEFREIYDTINGVKPYSGLKVAILNSWGKIRSWQTFMVAHALWYKQIYSYLGILESLSGMSVDVEFISFDDVKSNGINEDIDVIINAGVEGTAFSGGSEWLDEKLISTVRKWVYNGGGFIGIGEPAAIHHQGRYFQLADALGVDRELSFSLSTDKYFDKEIEEHFITKDIKRAIDFGESMGNVYALTEKTEIIEYSNGEVHLSSNDYGKGRAVYIAGLPYNEDNSRLLMRSMFYASHKEEELYKYFADNTSVEVNAYPDIKKYAITNNTDEMQKSIIYDGNRNSYMVELKPGEIRWMNI
ncbi:1,3-beta-galactosyl-N-acetylhexosamine phosphorylase [Senegalia massiliensis]|uniref:1,3-beta-galactosyl-N-acetylhexosamine phosphorylase n=1 Tax=Senegalia massiliensis TaxID=1720316 RepID=A0A845R1F9_9CLOT|nr:1,3-beta-galactosyl-N-acetylhexosamine phosphorylase [Senegalia massiliensis]NBI07348.1 1,3-beta-galactosyl-N-acetylhexosamine phosphorylase [Senegalia massiliensis]